MGHFKNPTVIKISDSKNKNQLAMNAIKNASLHLSNTDLFLKKNKLQAVTSEEKEKLRCKAYAYLIP